MQERLAALSPLNYLKEIHAPLIVLLHDRDDQVIPVGESRRLRVALAGHAGVHYNELLFQHLDPVKGRLPLLRLAQQLGKFFLAVYPLFRQAVAARGKGVRSQLVRGLGSRYSRLPWVKRSASR